MRTFILILLACLAAGPTAAQETTRRVRGAIDAVNGNTLSATDRVGNPLTIILKPNTAIVAIVLIMYRIVPPDLQKLQNLPMAKLFTGTGISLVPLLIIAIFIGPALEEMVFRGIAFAGIAARLGPLWAAIITTAIFMAAHAPEKIHYLPGFLDVGLLALTAIALRLKFHSIRPGILLHILYNAGSMVAASFMQ